MIMDKPVELVRKNSEIIFTGRLTIDETGEGLSDALVTIIDYDFDNTDDVLNSARTDSNGYFNIPWIVECVEVDENPCILELYAIFSGTDDYGVSYNDMFYELEISSFILIIIDSKLFLNLHII